MKILLNFQIKNHLLSTANQTCKIYNIIRSAFQHSLGFPWCLMGGRNPPCICPFTHGVEKSLYQLWHSGKKRSVIQHFPNYYVEQKQTHRYVEGRRRAEPKTINWVVNVISVSALRLFTTGNVSTLKLSRTEIHPTSQHYWDYSPRSRRAAGAFTKHAAVPGLHN